MPATNATRESYTVRIADIAKSSREHLRVELHDYRGHDLLSLRVWFDKVNGEGHELLPTTKGVTIAASLIPQLRAAFEQAERVATERGVLVGQGI